MPEKKHICSKCGSTFFHTSQFFSTPASDGFLGGFICPDCAREKKEEERHRERMKADERHHKEREDNEERRYRNSIDSGESSDRFIGSAFHNGKNKPWWDNGTGWGLLVPLLSYIFLPLLGGFLGAKIGGFSGGFLGFALGFFGAYVVGIVENTAVVNWPNPEKEELHKIELEYCRACNVLSDPSQATIHREAQTILERLAKDGFQPAAAELEKYRSIKPI